MLLLTYSLSSSVLLSPKDVRRLSIGLRRCLDDHWHDPGFVCMKVDMKNAFNLVSRQSLLDQCALHFPLLLLPWTEWCNSQHPFLWHSMGTLTSEAGVQQGDPLGPFYFALVLHDLVLTITKDNSCQVLLFNAWFLDDGVVAGPSSSVQHVIGGRRGGAQGALAPPPPPPPQAMAPHSPHPQSLKLSSITTIQRDYNIRSII